MPRGIRERPRELFWRKVKKLNNGCWEWQGCKNPHGYALFGSGTRLGVTSLAHRISYEWAKGEIPAGLTIDHLCRNRACVNPDHMEPVISGENTRRSDLVGKVWGNRQKALTHCKHGHPFNDENTYYRLDGSGRMCRACTRERMRRYARETRNGQN